MATLDSSIVNIALPTLTKTLGADLGRIKWVAIIYSIIITCLLLPFGRMSDQYGRKRIFQFGFLVFIIGSLLCGISPTLAWMLFSRTVQGVGASMLMANSPAIITAAFPAGERGKALGTLAMVVSAGLISGPGIGGILIAKMGWRSIFFINIPIGLLGITLAHRFITTDHKDRPSPPFDWGGAFLQTLLLLSFILLMDPPSISVSGSAPLKISYWIMTPVSVLLALIFVKVEAEARAPLFDLSLLRNRTFWTGLLSSFLMFASYSSLYVMMPFYLEEILKYSPDRMGLFMTAIPLTIFVVAPFSGRLSDKLGSQELSFSGALMAALGMFLMAGLTGPGLQADTGPVAIVLGLCLLGLATGMFQSPNNNAVMSSVQPSKLGVASALTATVRNLGFVTGTGMSTGVFAWKMEKSGGNFIDSFHLALLVAGLIAILAMITSLGKKRGPIRGPEDRGN